MSPKAEDGDWNPGGALPLRTREAISTTQSTVVSYGSGTRRRPRPNKPPAASRASPEQTAAAAMRTLSSGPVAEAAAKRSSNGSTSCGRAEANQPACVMSSEETRGSPARDGSSDAVMRSGRAVTAVGSAPCGAPKSRLGPTPEQGCTSPPTSASGVSPARRARSSTRAVPRERAPRTGSTPTTTAVEAAHRSLSLAASASVGTESKPAAGRSITPEAAARSPRACTACTDLHSPDTST
mmetsp:Transcript_37739/g.121054  ORF Transcript_37739/g.121054 Transcript_37739/m.121054 type:complete len:239 (+) Transcript_37739:130-846(+)